MSAYPSQETTNLWLAEKWIEFQRHGRVTAHGKRGFDVWLRFEYPLLYEYFFSGNRYNIAYLLPEHN